MSARLPKPLLAGDYTLAGRTCAVRRLRWRLFPFCGTELRTGRQQRGCFAAGTTGDLVDCPGCRGTTVWAEWCAQRSAAG